MKLILSFQVVCATVMNTFTSAYRDVPDFRLYPFISCSESNIQFSIYIMIINVTVVYVNTLDIPYGAIESEITL